MTDKKKSQPEYDCDICGEHFIGNGYFRHKKTCKRDAALGIETKTLYPVKMPADLLNRFKAKCIRNNQTMGERINALVKEDVN